MIRNVIKKQLKHFFLFHRAGEISTPPSFAKLFISSFTLWTLDFRHNTRKWLTYILRNDHVASSFRPNFSHFIGLDGYRCLRRLQNPVPFNPPWGLAHLRHDTRKWRHANMAVECRVHWPWHWLNLFLSRFNLRRSLRRLQNLTHIFESHATQNLTNIFWFISKNNLISQGWTDIDASVVCKTLGLVIHPEDWRIYDTIPGSDDMPLWRSSVECIDLDIDNICSFQG